MGEVSSQGSLVKVATLARMVKFCENGEVGAVDQASWVGRFSEVSE